MTDKDLASALIERFGQQVPVPDTLAEHPALATMAARGACRWFDDRAVREDILRALYAIALASPSKSDLQRRNIEMVSAPDQLKALKSLLSEHVFALAGLAVGYPQFPTPRISMRLPLDATLRADRYTEPDLEKTIRGYDAARHAHRPATSQRQPHLFGSVDPCTWSDDKTRQYS